jgi:hypothetical protein
MANINLKLQKAKVKDMLRIFCIFRSLCILDLPLKNQLNYASILSAYTDPGETVLDITAGSGTTAVATVNLDRDWVAFEKERDCYHVAARRIGEAMELKERSMFFSCFPGQKFQIEP